jgi:hypothetical protein
MVHKNLFQYQTGKPKFIINYDQKNDFYYDLIQYELDHKIYYFGDNFKNHYEIRVGPLFKIKSTVKKLATFTIVFFKTTFLFKKNTHKIWNSANFNFDSHFNSSEHACGSPPWHPRIKSTFNFDFKLYLLTIRIKNKLEFYHANELVESSFFKEIDIYILALKNYIIENKIVAVFLPQTMGFFEKVIVYIFKELGRPTFLFNHGLPYYWGSCDNLANYFVVWGSAIKGNYVKKGYNENNIIVSGHPLYRKLEIKNLKFDLDNILILTKSMNGIPSYDEYTLRDRSNCIVYLNMIQLVLKSLGVTRVRFRPHPSENSNWYLKYIDNNFYSVDTEKLAKSLKLSTVVIGPTSSVFLESLLAQVNYVIFEPTLDNGNSFDNVRFVPPFDNTDTRVPIANDIDSLLEILNKKIRVDTSIINEYCLPEFNVEAITRILKQNINPVGPTGVDDETER